MDERGKMHLKCPGRSAGDGMENVSYPEYEAIHRSPPDYFHKNFVLSQGKVKEPKFVPYEPYRAAVSPIISSSHCPGYVIDSQKVNSLASNVMRLYSNSDVKENQKSCSADCSTKIKTLEEKIASLEKEKKELASQYQVQAEVNMDLKKLLVASLGEDVQVKVQFMTQDKAHLGKEVLRLSTELEQVGEEAKQHALLSELWEGKFKASSVLVRDLAQWKSSFSRNLEKSTVRLQALLREHSELFDNMSSAQRNLESIAAAFDPSIKSNRHGNSSPVDLLQLGMQLKSLSCNLKERLLGKSLQPDTRPQCVRQFTQSESEASKLLQSVEQTSGSSNLSLCSPGMVACQVLPHQCDRPLDFCKHCSGEVQIL